MGVAIFDVDRTLLDGMAGYYFWQFLWRRRHLLPRGRWETVKSYILYRTKIRPESVMVEAGVTGLAGLSPAHVDGWAETCVEEMVWPKVYTEALEAIARHRAQGDFVVLASGSARAIVAALARRSGAHDIVSTEAEIDERGRYRPIARRPLCYAEGKTTLVEDLLAREGHAIAEATFYTDNYPDLTLLERVAHPVAVNPDDALRAIAVSRGWPILRWHRAVTGEGTGTAWPLKGE